MILRISSLTLSLTCYQITHFQKFSIPILDLCKTSQLLTTSRKRYPTNNPYTFPTDPRITPLIPLSIHHRISKTASLLATLNNTSHQPRHTTVIKVPTHSSHPSPLKIPVLKYSRPTLTNVSPSKSPLKPIIPLLSSETGNGTILNIIRSPARSSSARTHTHTHEHRVGQRRSPSTYQLAGCRNRGGRKG